MRVLGIPLERLAEGLLLDRSLVAERSRQLAHHRIADHHRRGLPAAQHVTADRDDIGGEGLEDALVEALVAPAQQRQLGLGGELRDERLVEQPATRCERDHPPPLAQLDRVDAVVTAYRAVEDVHPQHHPGPAAEGRVVDLAARERCVATEVDARDRRARRDRIGDVAL